MEVVAALLSGRKKKKSRDDVSRRMIGTLPDPTPHAGPRRLTAGLEALTTKDSSTLLEQRLLIG